MRQFRNHNHKRAGGSALDEEYPNITPLYIPYYPVPHYLKPKNTKDPKIWYKLENFWGKGLIILKHYPGYHKDQVFWMIDYEVVDRHGDWVYTASERSAPWQMKFFGRGRSSIWILRDQFFVLAIKMRRLFRCSSMFCCCCLQKLIIEHPPYHKTAFVVQNWSPYPRFTVLDGKGETIFRIKGPDVFQIKNAIDSDFIIIEHQKNVQIGIISRRFANLLDTEEGELDLRNCIGVQFPYDSPAYVKGMLVAATYLIYVTYFERPNSKKLSKMYTGPEVIGYTDLYDLIFR